MKTKLFLFVVLSYAFSALAQNEVNYYNFAHIPQSIMSNPSYDIDKKIHVGVPLISNFRIDLGSSGVNLYDLFADNGIPIEEKFRATIYQMTEKDGFLINQKTDLINIGYRLSSDRYLSFGVYQELDFYSTFPKSIAELFYEGTSILEKRYTIEGFAMQADLLGVYHVGLQQKIDKNLSIGGRIKMYSGALSVKSTGNKGYIYTDLGNDNLYRHGLSTLNTGVETAGVVTEDDDYLSPSKLTQKILFSGNKGIGFDLGMTYSIDDNMTFSTSITDIGFIYNNKEIQNYKIAGSYQTEGIQMNFDPDNPVNYWKDIETALNENIIVNETNSSYLSWRPTQLTTALTYSFGQRRLAECNYYGKPSSRMSSSSMGGLLRVQKRPETVLYGGSVFYEKNFNNILQTRISYTADKFSYTNIGIAASLQVWKINLFAGVNDIIGLVDLSKANTASAQFGLHVSIE